MRSLSPGADPQLNEAIPSEELQQFQPQPLDNVSDLQTTATTEVYYIEGGRTRALNPGAIPQLNELENVLGKIQGFDPQVFPDLKGVTVVLSVNGRTGDVTLSKSDVGLSHVDDLKQEPWLGNPPQDGYVLESTAGGTRSWVPAEISSDKTYVHTQNSPDTTWVIYHNLGKFPSITVVDSAGDVVEGDISYIDDNTAMVLFSAPFGGKAFCN